MVWDRWVWSVALRQLRFSVAQTLLTMAVVGISVTLIIFLGSLIGGLQERLIQDITGSIPNIVISQPERYPITPDQVPSLDDDDTIYFGERRLLEQRKEKIEDWQIWIQRIRATDGDITAVTPVASGNALLASGANQRGVVVTGVFPEEYDRVVGIQSDITAGRFIGLRSEEVALGETIADDLALEIGDKVRISTSDAAGRTFSVAGVFSTGAQQVDSSIVYIPLRDAQSLFGLSGAVTSIDIKIDDIFEAPEVARRLQAQIPYEVEPWTEENENLLTALRSQSQTSNLILTFTTLAAGFAIASILITLVTSKLKEIGILRAIGATRRQIIGLFTLESTIMATIGAILGAVFGIVLSNVTYQARLAVAGGDEDQVFPNLLTPQLVLGAVGIAIFVGFVASLYPAYRAAKVNPIEVIRSG